MENNETKETNEEVIEEVTEEVMEEENTKKEIRKEAKAKKAYEKDLLETMQELAKAEEERDEYLDLAKRTQAEFMNFKKRNQNVVAGAYDSSICEVVADFLQVLDNLDRAREVAEKAESNDMLTGIDMVIKQFLDTMKKYEVEEIEAMGKEFDPNVHNAVMQAPAEEGQEPHTVVGVFQKGYIRKGQVIRPSMVRVAGE